jgi:hypothetical protein
MRTTASRAALVGKAGLSASLSILTIRWAGSRWKSLPPITRWCVASHLPADLPPWDRAAERRNASELTQRQMRDAKRAEAGRAVNWRPPDYERFIFWLGPASSSGIGCDRGRGAIDETNFLGCDAVDAFLFARSRRLFHIF